MKKTTVKSAKPVAAAKKSAPAKVVKKPAAKASVAKAKAPAAKKTPAAKPSATIISAFIDIGFGNTLYIRGEGAGLSWDAGLPMDCVNDGHWSIQLKGAVKPVAYKLLVNDLSWSVGPDYTVTAGGKVTVTPAF